MTVMQPNHWIVSTHSRSVTPSVGPSQTRTRSGHFPRTEQQVWFLGPHTTHNTQFTHDRVVEGGVKPKPPAETTMKSAAAKQNILDTPCVYGAKGVL
jgi:hypothetical protein